MTSTAESCVRIALESTPDLLQLHQFDPARYPFILQSVADGNPLGRYDLLFACPQETLTLDAGYQLTGRISDASKTFLSTFDDWWQSERTADVDNSLPFRGGWFMMLGYELAREIEPTLQLSTDPVLPVAVATRIPVAVVLDRDTGDGWLIHEPDYAQQAAQVLADLAALKTDANRESVSGPVLTSEFKEEDPRQFIDAIERAQHYIRAGDIFQANLSRRWTGPLHPDVQPADLYTRLRRANPAPFAGLASYADFALLSSSPERLLRIRQGRVETRPIAGTCPREGAGSDVESLRRRLLEDPKERAEHVMVIDLERNDLGRICQPGTVEVDEFMVIESYSHVHHIVSNVSGRLNKNITPGEAIAAVFPGGSITGCPKVRCMEIIAELEGRPRGLYTGAMGYINRDGSLDLSILIRSLTMADGTLALSTGCGIVADSDPVREVEETRAKAKGLLLAVMPDHEHPR